MDRRTALSSSPQPAGRSSTGRLSTGRLLARRAARQRGQLAALAGVLVVAAAAAVVLPALTEQGMREGAATLLAAQSADARAVRVSTGSGADGRDAEGARILRALFPAGTVRVTASTRTTDVPVLSASTTSSAGAAESADASDAARVVLGTESDLTGIRVTAGSWPGATDSAAPADSPVPTAVQADAARALGLTVGDRVVVGSSGASATLRVSALWTARDPLSARWFGDPLVGSGRDGLDAGPLLVRSADLTRLDGIAEEERSWTVGAEPEGLAPLRVAALASGLDRVADALPAARVTAADDTDVDGSLPTTVEAVRAADGVARALLAVALALVAGAGIVSVVQLAGLVALARRPETDLLQARGATSAQFIAAAVSEAVVLAVPAALVGLLLGSAASRLVDPEAPWASTGTAAELAVTLGVTVVGAAALVAVAEWRAARVGAAGLVGAATRSAAGTGFAVATVVALLAAGFGVWRLDRSGLTATGTDPVAALSPVLVLVAGALVSAVLFGIVAAGVARALARSRSAGPALIARQLARRRGSFAAAVLTVALVTAGAGFTTSLAATASAVDADAARITLGSGARIAGSGELITQPGAQPVTAGPVSRFRAVADAATVLDDRASIGQQDAQVVGIAAARTAALLGADPDTRTIATALRPTRGDGIELPAGSRILTAAVSATAPTESGFGVDGTPTAPPGSVSLVAWLMDSDGATVALPLRSAAGGGSVTAGDPLPLGTTATLTATLPAAAGRWRVLALEPALQVEVPDGVTVASTLQVAGLKAGPTASAVTAVPASLRTRLDTDEAAGRLPLGGAPATTRIPIVITPSLARSLGASRGSPLDVTLASTNSTVSATVAGVARTIPGSGSPDALAVDLPTLAQAAVLSGQAVPRARDVWVRPEASAGGASLARQAAAELPYATQTTTASAWSAEPVVGRAITSMLVASAAAALLALVVLAAAAAGLARARREEGAALRAIGIAPRRHGALRAAELGWSVVGGLVGGGATGVVAAELAAAHVGIAASPGASTLFVVDAVLDPARWSLLVALAAIPAAVVVLVAGALASRRAAAASVTGSDR